MAHVAKFGAGASGHMLSHYDRSKENIGGNIDWERTHLNYNLAPERNGSQLDFIHQRLSEIKVQKRKDVNVFCDWVVTLPKYEYCNKDIHITPDREKVEKLFFERTYQFLADRYGEKNVISAYVHMDEKTPHMHFAFVPATADKKWNEQHPDSPREKLSAKDVLTRVDLKSFHSDLERHLDNFHDWHFEIQNEATRDGNKSIAELKRGTAIEEVAKVRQQADKEIQQIKAEVQHERVQADVTKSGLKEQIKDLERKRDGLLTSLEVEEKKGSKTILGGLRGVSYVEYQAVWKTALEVDDMRERVKSADERVSKAYADATSQLNALRKSDNEVLKQKENQLYKEYSEKTNKVMWRNDHLERENKQLSSKISRQEEIIDYLKSVIREKVPDMVKSMENRLSQIMNRTQGRGRGD